VQFKVLTYFSYQRLHRNCSKTRTDDVCCQHKNGVDNLFTSVVFDNNNNNRIEDRLDSQILIFLHFSTNACHYL
jgi:hypothetical protein